MPKIADIKVERSGANNKVTVKNFTAGNFVDIFRSNQHNTAFERIVFNGEVNEYLDPASSDRKYKGQLKETESNEIINTSTEIINTSTEFIYKETVGAKSKSVFTKQ